MNAKKLLLVLLSLLIAVAIVTLRNRARSSRHIELKPAPEVSPSPSPQIRSGQFRTSDPDAVISRAQSILEGASRGLGIQAGTLSEPVARVGKVAAQVFYKQVHEGAEVVPYGNVTVDLGRDGELLSLESDYVPSLTSENERMLTSAQARPPGTHVIGGAPVFWIAMPSSTSGRHAYEYWIDGKQIVVDAATGNRIFERDRRKYLSSS